jgi:hypothetical protein
LGGVKRLMIEKGDDRYGITVSIWSMCWGHRQSSITEILHTVVGRGASYSIYG